LKENGKNGTAKGNEVPREVEGWRHFGLAQFGIM